MIARIVRRFQATFRGPTTQDALAEIAQLRSELQALRATAEPFHTRPDTHDLNICGDVLFGNEYKLPDRFEATDVIVDIGAHIGSFAAACLLRGVGRVVSFEPHPANFALARVNLARYGLRSEVRRQAVWRSDRPAGTVSYFTSPDHANTGGGGVLGGATSKLTVPTVPLDTVIHELLAATGQPRLRLLKLDCEGSEFPVLLTTTSLHLVKEICGEYHDVGAVSGEDAVADHTHYTHAVLVKHLQAAGFTVTVEVHPRNPAIGLFWARRPAQV